MQVEPRLASPRIRPLRPEEWTLDQHKLLAGVFAQGQYYNMFGTMARNMAAQAARSGWSRYVMGPGNSLDSFQREAVILRIGWRSRSSYVWAQHTAIARGAGFREGDFERIRAGPEAAGSEPIGADLMRAADEIHDIGFITEATLSRLGVWLSRRQLMDVVFSAGQYRGTAMFSNALGIQVDGAYREQGPRHRPDAGAIDPSDATAPGPALNRWSGYLEQSEVLGPQLRDLVVFRIGLRLGPADPPAVPDRAPTRSALELAVLNAVDELQADDFISDDVWNTLRARLSDAQLVEFILMVGHGGLLASLRRTFDLGGRDAFPADHAP